jgi:hypothetical protein
MIGLNYLSEAEAEVYHWRNVLNEEIKGMTIREEVDYINKQAENALKICGLSHLMLVEDTVAPL